MINCEIIHFDHQLDIKYRSLALTGSSHLFDGITPHQGLFWKSAWIDLNGNVPHNVALQQEPALCLSE